MLIVMILWGMIGYLFADRYIKTEILGSAIAAFVAIIIIVQIERQIILTVGQNSRANWMRGGIAVIMAILGSLITDQIIFKDDVEIHKQKVVQARIDELLPKRATEIDNQLVELSATLAKKEIERADLIQEITLNPTINLPTSTSKRVILPGDSVAARENTYVIASVPNPKNELIPSINEQIKDIRTQLSAKEERRINLRMETEKELMDQVGFLDELEILFGIIFSSFIAFFVWLLLFLFFVLIELFVLFTKRGDGKNDYDDTVLHQMNVHMKKIENLSQR